MKKIELLAPSGNMESLKAAVAGGCDAVYLGMTVFSARAFAGNFDRDQLKEAVRYCHIRGVRVYVTMNTMLYETEIENAKDTVRFLYENDVDALLIQDLGLFHLVRTMYPDFDVHCSTQMHIHNLAGVRLMQKEGASRVVLARETPIEIIREACLTGMEIEVFAYGAICISYSGQCLMSAALKNRSANRGMCAQCCRLKYFPEEGGRFREGDYILSPKDLNVIRDIPQLIEAGVSSLKIEGRMKRPEYVYLVTKTFREAIDAFYDGKPYHVSGQREEELLLMFNRGFSRGHLFHDDVTARMSQYRPNHRGIRIGTVVSARKGAVTVRLSRSLRQHDGLRILHSPQDIGLTAMRILKDGRPVTSAGKGDVVQLTCPKDAIPMKGEAVQKTSDTELISRTDEEIRLSERKIPVRMTYEAVPGKPFALHVTDADGNVVSAFSSQPAEAALTAPMTAGKIAASLGKTGEYPFEAVSVNGETGDVFLPVSVINETRRHALDDLAGLRAVRHRRSGMRPYHAEIKPGQPLPRLLAGLDGIRMEAPDLMTFSGQQICPTVNENLHEAPDHEHCLLSSAADLAGTHRSCVAGMTMNIANSYALAYVLSFPGVDGAVYSSECSTDQIRQAEEAFRNRYGFAPQTYMPVFGKRVLMTVKDRFLPEKITGFRDLHGDSFSVRRSGQATEILESRPHCAANRHAWGSFVMLDDAVRNPQAVLNEARAELREREKTAE